MEELTDIRAGLIAMLLRRLDGITATREQKLLMFDAAEQALPAISALPFGYN